MDFPNICSWESDGPVSRFHLEESVHTPREGRLYVSVRLTARSGAQRMDLLGKRAGPSGSRDCGVSSRRALALPLCAYSTVRVLRYVTFQYSSYVLRKTL